VELRLALFIGAEKWRSLATLRNRVLLCGGN
jgi:hypothetical protein